LRDTAAHIRFVSAEPLLEDLGELDLSGIQWLIAGGESGGKARPFDVAWAESLQRQCVDQGVSLFMKQLGAHPLSGDQLMTIRTAKGRRDSHAGEFEFWPPELSPLMVRQFPSPNS